MKYLSIFYLLISITIAQDNFIGDVFEKGSINYGDRTIQAIGIGFIPENVINAGQARRSAMRIANLARRKIKTMTCPGQAESMPAVEFLEEDPLRPQRHYHHEGHIFEEC